MSKKQCKTQHENVIIWCWTRDHVPKSMLEENQEISIDHKQRSLQDWYSPAGVCRVAPCCTNVCQRHDRQVFYFIISLIDAK